MSATDGTRNNICIDGTTLAVRPIEVTAGISDGAVTAVTAEGLHEGDEVVTGEIITKQADLKNPFLPRQIRR